MNSISSGSFRARSVTNLIPLDEIIAEAKGVGKASKAVAQEYRTAIAKFGTEFDILLKADQEQLKKALPQRVAEAVLRVRKGQLIVKPGFDGEYGQVSIFSDEEKDKKNEEQLNLF